jgi:hypothetical protein
MAHGLPSWEKGLPHRPGCVLSKLSSRPCLKIFTEAASQKFAASLGRGVIYQQMSALSITTKQPEQHREQNNRRADNMPRNDHHCPGASGPVDGFPGNCRWVKVGVHHCETHMNTCLLHRVAYMKSKHCVACDRRECLRSVLSTYSISSTHHTIGKGGSGSRTQLLTRVVETGRIGGTLDP